MPSKSTKKTQINDISHSSSPQPNAGVFYWELLPLNLDGVAVMSLPADIIPPSEF
jgi:hypothetical protein